LLKGCVGIDFKKGWGHSLLRRPIAFGDWDPFNKGLTLKHGAALLCKYVVDQVGIVTVRRHQAKVVIDSGLKYFIDFGVLARHDFVSERARQRHQFVS
jgi:hypothetical protein